MRPFSRDVGRPIPHSAALLTPTNPGSNTVPILFALLFFILAAGYLAG